ncbi:hypothetical protein [Pigmentiphaga humi]|nr:hypothetical protein [Pigmentiphaga humi]
MNDYMAPFVAAVALFAGHAAAAEPELDRVREMLRLDTERALVAERSRTPKPAPARAVAAAGDTLALASLYGTKGALTAVVVVNGQPRLYRQGREQARGASAGRQDYVLRRIDDGCVVLRKGAAERTACFDASAALPTPPARPVAAMAPGVHALQAPVPLPRP